MQLNKKNDDVDGGREKNDWHTEINGVNKIECFRRILKTNKWNNRKIETKEKHELDSGKFTKPCKWYWNWAIQFIRSKTRISISQKDSDQVLFRAWESTQNFRKSFLGFVEAIEVNIGRQKMKKNKLGESLLLNHVSCFEVDELKAISSHWHDRMFNDISNSFLSLIFFVSAQFGCVPNERAKWEGDSTRKRSKPIFYFYLYWWYFHRPSTHWIRHRLSLSRLSHAPIERENPTQTKLEKRCAGAEPAQQKKHSMNLAKWKTNKKGEESRIVGG